MFRTIDLALSSPTLLVTNAAGEFALLSPPDHAALTAGTLPEHHPRYLDLLARNFIARPERGGKGLELAVGRTRKAFALDGPSLHIFVVTLRCDHACGYCQVSRAALDATGYDMSWEHANAALDRVFESPAHALTIEFQGGEPALRFDLVRQIVLEAEARNDLHGRELRFSMVSTLHHLGVEELAFCRDHEIHISTSIDGPAAMHDRQRPNPTRDSWTRTIAGLERARSILGYQGVVAMPTLTKAALSNPRAVIDTYRDLGFGSIFLRPISPYGFARKTRRAIGYEMSEFIAFYAEALAYLLELNRQGETMVETYASILLRHILTPFHTGYVDLRSPAGAGLGVLVYNYDGQVYPADEARMAAETGDTRFALGRVDDTLEALLTSPAMRWLAQGSIAETLPGCRDCAFVPFCGADPVYHAAAQGDPIGDRATSEFCAKHMGLFKILFGHIAEGDPETMRTFTAWALNRPREDIVEAGFVEQ
ncbi:His-Xaa-Ser system radical SAM maturase HxsB [Phenylobacterium sp.]|uniref:His-Xaa-Ser system radical SAM maturase HxsB n=1 Tax=Phenylobacterium sp. TaxID=1871053 RepID=UPI002737FA72|nr:His-Xaa-Ser system radical SAM maturase HxsB [Phenylobacterium sp.]MDP3870417.1 His-Xaa-Ser system radical SAM maturase HxsB [Phenylobacterium sp.]